MEHFSDREKLICTEVLKIFAEAERRPNMNEIFNKLEQMGVTVSTKFENEAEIYNALTHFLEAYYGKDNISKQIGTVPGWNPVKKWMDKTAKEITL